jgi:hypothetical protein
MIKPASLESVSAVVRAYAPRQGRPVLRGEPQEQARKAFAARARKREATRVKVASGADAMQQGVTSVHRGREAVGRGG